ncbi:hypothetical protein CNMCM5793_001577 [Aspergillus hiratsukae]|uniref:Xylanolytic transcriptional activator regulatory domain-containing protein n=1 Tax=Aspergillus hiratsukae TaxID=1194566 RepID=A0A8H6PBI8_9EURO|nr:hypothetical protein CNMCM5793_001577 [Aspergillus hiratsukae]KAF7164095.1 hypothetical protein CNMCM6106_000753 [Aspergillus hiratsukae]
MRDQAPNSGHSHSTPPNQAADSYDPVPDNSRTEFQYDQPEAHAGYQRSDGEVVIPPLGLETHLGLSQPLQLVGNSNGAPTVQRIRSLDQIDGSTAQLFGMSSESDPWLLRHCRYDEYGMRSLHRTHFRHVGGVPVERLVPVHFLVTDNDLLAPAKEATRIRGPGGPDMARAELDAMVAPEHGRRLLSLFLTFVFPAMPVISRSQLGISPSGPVSSLSHIPVHLLAAIYTSALPFVVHDPVLCVSAAYEEQLSARLLRMVYDLLAEEIHTPKLSVLQASLLYLQQMPTGTQRSVSDSPFVWSFLGSVVAQATSLGLHLEPRPWGIPAWEKRLRRRLWWAVYLEDKWRSLLMGRPPFIHHEDFDVSELDGNDFVVDGNQAATLNPASDYQRETIFIHATQLACVVEKMHQTFYTLKASQKLSGDFRASINAARPIRTQLQNWYSSLPDSLHLNSRPDANAHLNYGRVEGTADLQLSYLVLEMFLYRAILRPLASSPQPPPISEDKDPSPMSSPWFLEDLTFDGHGFDQLPASNFLELGEAAEATLNAAEKCAAILVNFVGTLLPRDFGSFWHPRTRICFAAVSNFVTLLLVQSPTAKHAWKSKYMLDIWSRTLRSQHRSHEGLMNLGLVRVNMLQMGGLEKNFVLQPHVADVLRQAQVEAELPT